MSQKEQIQLLRSRRLLEKEIEDLKSQGVKVDQKVLKIKQQQYLQIESQLKKITSFRDVQSENLDNLSSISNYTSTVNDNLVDQESSYNSLYGISGLLKEKAQQIVHEQKNYLGLTQPIVQENENLSNLLNDMLGVYSDIGNQSERASKAEKEKFKRAQEILEYQKSIALSETSVDRDKAIEDLKKLVTEFDNLNKSTNGYVSKISDVNDSISNIQKLEFVDPNIIPTLAQINDLSVQLADLSEEDAIQREVILDKIDKLKTSLTSMAGIQDKTLKTVDSQIKKAEYLGSLSERQRTQLESQLEAYENIRNMFGSVGDTIAVLRSGFLSAIGQITIGLGVMVSKVGEFNKELGMSLGDVGSLQLSAAGLGLVFEDANAAAMELANTFGTMPVTFDLQLQTNLLSQNLGTSAQETVALTKAFSMLNEGSTDVAADMMVSARETAKMAGVVPSAVMKDLAKNTETFALHAKDGGKNIAEAAIYASQLGVEMDALNQVTDSLLDYETSITKELELSAMLGRNINLNRARALAYEGDIQGAVNETLNQLGGIEAFNQMDYYQKKQTADLLGISVEELKKMADNQASLTQEVGLVEQGYNKLTESITAIGNTFAGTVMQGAGGFLITLGQINMGLNGIGTSMLNLIKASWRFIMMPFKAVYGGISNMFSKSMDKGKGFFGSLKDGWKSTVDAFKGKKPDLTPDGGISDKLKKVEGPDTQKISKSADKDLNRLSKGLGSMGSKRVEYGILNLKKSAAAFRAMIPGSVGMQSLSKVNLTKVSTGLSAIAKSLTTYGKPTVTVGAKNLKSSAMGFMLMTLGAVGMWAISSLGVRTGIGLGSISKALGSMGKPTVASGAKNLVIAAAGFTLMTLGAIGMGVIALLGIPLGAGLTAMAAGVTKMGGKGIIKGVIGIALLGAALIPFTFALSLLQDVDVGVILTTIGALVAFGIAAAVIGSIFPTILLGALGIGLIGLALIPFTFALSQLQGVDMGVLASAAITLGVFALAAAAIGSIFPLISLGAIGIGMIGLALIPFTFALTQLQGVDMGVLLSASIALGVFALAAAGIGAILPLIQLGAVGITLIGLSLIPFTAALSNLSTIDPTILQSIGSSLADIGSGAMMLGAGIFSAILGITALALTLPLLITVSQAFLIFGGALLMAGIGSSMLATSLPIISQSIQQMVEYVEGINAVSDAILKLSTSLSALSFASILAAPAMLAISLFGKQTAEAAPKEGEGGEVESFSILEQAIRETNEMLISEIRGLRDDLNSGKISVNMDGDSVTSKIVRNINRSATNMYGLKG